MKDSESTGWAIALTRHGALMYGTQPNDFFIINDPRTSLRNQSETLTYYPYPELERTYIYDDSGNILDCPSYKLIYSDRLALIYYIDFDRGSDDTGTGTANNPWKSFIGAAKYFDETGDSVDDTTFTCALQRKLCCMGEKPDTPVRDIIKVARCAGLAKEEDMFGYVTTSNGVEFVGGLQHFDVIENLNLTITTSNCVYTDCKYIYANGCVLVNCTINYNYDSDIEVSYGYTAIVTASLLVDSVIQITGKVRNPWALVYGDTYNCQITATWTGSTSIEVYGWGNTVNSTISGVFYGYELHIEGCNGNAINSTITITAKTPSIELTLNKDDYIDGHSYSGWMSSAWAFVGEWNGYIVDSTVTIETEVGGVTINGANDLDNQSEIYLVAESVARCYGVSCGSNIKQTASVGNLTLNSTWSGICESTAESAAIVEAYNSKITCTATNVGGSAATSGAPGDYGVGTYPVLRGSSTAYAVTCARTTDDLPCSSDGGNASAKAEWINLPESSANWGSHRQETQIDSFINTTVLEHRYWVCVGDPALGEPVSCSWVTEEGSP